MSVHRLLHDPHLEEDRTPWVGCGQEECRECGAVKRSDHMVPVNDFCLCQSCAEKMEEEIPSTEEKQC